MYLLYLDESGNPDNPTDKHFVLAGAAVFERVTYFLSQAFDAVQTAHFPGVQPIAFHATDIRSGQKFWRDIAKERRSAVLNDLCKAIADSNHPGVFLFGVVIEKNAQLFGESAVRRATEDICRRFDKCLVRQFKKFNNPQRGVIVFAESHYQKRHRLWVRDFRELGTQWGAINNLSDIPYFGTPHETRLLQVADLVAHALFRLYEKKDNSLVTPFINRFDEWDGIMHGLVHVSPNMSTCECPACTSRREPGSFGPWI